MLELDHQPLFPFDQIGALRENNTDMNAAQEYNSDYSRALNKYQTTMGHP